MPTAARFHVVVTHELECDEVGAVGVRKIARDHMRKALRALEGERPGDDDIHTARKELKKARASLRLLRQALGDAVYRRENVALRDAARPLARLRDAKALAGALRELVNRPSTRRPNLTAVQRALAREHARARRRIASGNQFEGSHAAVRAAVARSAKWPVGGHGWTVLGAGLRRTYASGRKAFASAEAERTGERLHEWRKQVKYLWHELQVLQPMWPGLIGELADQAHQLADYLGDEHDLHVLLQKLSGPAGKAAHPAAVRSLRALGIQRRAELQDKALALGRRLYDEKPRALEARFGRYWHTWRAPRAGRRVVAGSQPAAHA